MADVIVVGTDGSDTANKAVNEAVRLGKALGADHKAIQRWHAQGIAMIVAVLRAAP